MKLFTQSVGRKISLIILLAIMATGFLIMVSFFFFGKIGQIGDIVKSAYEYEVFIGTAKFEFEKYKATGDTAYLDRFRKTIGAITRRDGTIGELHGYLSRGMSETEAVMALRKVHSAMDSQVAAAKLIKTLMGTPLMDPLLEAAGKGHVITTGWGRLVEDYAGADEAGKKAIAAAIGRIETDLPQTLDQFHEAMEGIADYLSGTIKRVFLILGSIMVVLTIGIAVVITRSITKPLKLTVDHVNDIAQGNFMNTLEIRNRDELGVMVTAMNEMSVQLKDMVLDIKQGISTLNASAGDLSSFSDEMSDNAVSNAEKSNIVASSAEEMSINMASVSQAMETSAQNTNSVVTAVEQMTVTINEIAKNTESAKGITENAVARSDSAAAQMSRLEKAADAIGQVTDTIQDISAQTDLLSLNATIEAARAGEAGKGFAVVANEIKELSRQTSDATTDIQTQVDAIQGTAADAVAVIREISGIVVEVNGIVATIASAIEEQSIATREISENTGHVSQGITEANHQVGQGAAAAREITESIQEVHQSSDRMESKSRDIKGAAFDLTRLADSLGSLMARFKVD